MSYTPKEWVCGETITADALNNLEGGVQQALTRGGYFVITFTPVGDGTDPFGNTISWDNGNVLCDKTIAEIREAYDNGYTLVAIVNYQQYDERFLPLLFYRVDDPYGYDFDISFDGDYSNFQGDDTNYERMHVHMTSYDDNGTEVIEKIIQLDYTLLQHSTN